MSVLQVVFSEITCFDLFYHLHYLLLNLWFIKCTWEHEWKKRYDSLWEKLSNSRGTEATLKSEALWVVIKSTKPLCKGQSASASPVTWKVGMLQLSPALCINVSTSHPTHQIYAVLSGKPHTWSWRHHGNESAAWRGHPSSTCDPHLRADAQRKSDRQRKQCNTISHFYGFFFPLNSEGIKSNFSPL